MSFSENGSMSPADYAAINGNNGFGFGGDGAWWVIILLLLAGNGGWGNGFGGGYEMPYFYNTQTQNDVNRGFENQSILTSLGTIASAINGGFADAAVSQCNQTTTLLQTLNNNQNATTAAMNSIAMGLQNCCCENRAGLADLKYTVATENCADRYEAAQNTRDIIESANRNSQAILDKLCALELDGVKSQLAQVNRDNLNLQNQLNMKTLEASQIAQTDNIVNDIYNRLSNCPVPSVSVFGKTPVFTCNNGCGCGCGA